MTTFRYKFADGDWKIKLAMISIAMGFLGFFACWTTLYLGEQRVFSSQIFAAKTAERPVPITAKGHTYFVEVNYGRRYYLALHAIFLIWTLVAIGGAYVNRRERMDHPK